MYCCECGKEFEAQDKRIRLCPECKEAKKNKIKTCVVCGVELSGNARKYCIKCAESVKRNQIQKAMFKRHIIAIDKDIYNNFLVYFPKPTKEIEKLMLSRLEEVSNHG